MACCPARRFCGSVAQSPCPTFGPPHRDRDTWNIEDKLSLNYLQKRGCSLAALKTDLAAFEEINQPTRRCHLGNECEIFLTKRSEDLNPILLILIISLTRRWQPLSSSLIWSPTLAPPYTTAGRTCRIKKSQVSFNEESSVFQTLQQESILTLER